jgi:hypothetical protein
VSFLSGMNGHQQKGILPQKEGAMPDDLIRYEIEPSRLSVTLSAVIGYRVTPCGFGIPSGQAGDVTSLNSLISLTYRRSFGNMCAYPGLAPPLGFGQFSSP